MEALASSPLACVLGRYALGPEIARGGMATVHLGLALGEAGFARIVAVKRLLPDLARDPEFVAAFLDEAKLASRIRHPNVVPTLDVLAQDGEIFVVMEYVHGESLAGLVRAAAGSGQRIPVPVVSAILANALHGLHAAHEAKDERGAPLHLVHRDVSPQNVLVGADGIARVLDFGIAKAAGRAQITREGQVKGKLGYLAPEQLRQSAERASDIYASGVCLWEALTMERLFSGDNESVVLARIMAGLAAPPSSRGADVPPDLDALTLRALHRNPQQRFATAREMARALEAAVTPAPPSEVGEWVEQLAGPRLTRRAEQMADVEASRATAPPTPPTPPPETARAADVATRPIAWPVPQLDAPRVPAPPTPTIDAFEVAPRPRPRRWTWLAGGGLSLLLATGALLAAVSKGTHAAAEGSATALPAPTAPPASTEASAATALPVTTGSAAPDAPPAVSSSPPSPSARRRSHPSTPSPAKIDCDPPYSVGADQVRHYKKQCLR